LIIYAEINEEGDLVAIDTEAVKVILAYGAKNRLPSNPRELPQIATALRHSLGVGGSEYTVVEQL
jgi:hypothetical protein